MLAGARIKGPVAGTCALASIVAVSALSSGAAWARPQAFTPTVVMTVTDTALNFRSVSGLAPGTVPNGKISFQLRNNAHGWRTFTIQNKTTLRRCVEHQRASASIARQ